MDHRGRSGRGRGRSRNHAGGETAYFPENSYHNSDGVSSSQNRSSRPMSMDNRSNRYSNAKAPEKQGWKSRDTPVAKDILPGVENLNLVGDVNRVTEPVTPIMETCSYVSVTYPKEDYPSSNSMDKGLHFGGRGRGQVVNEVEKSGNVEEKPLTGRSPHEKYPQKETEDSRSSDKINPSSTVLFDICPPRSVPALNSSIFEVNRMKRDEAKRFKEGQKIIKLRSGMILLKNYISFNDQVNLVKGCRDIGLGPGGFYEPGYSDGAKLHLKMMCLGKNWDPEKRAYGDKRESDGAKPPLIPNEFRQLVKGAMEASHSFLGPHSKSPDVLPSMSPNICIVNFYTSSGRLGLHQDKDESKESINRRLPVVSFSIGDTAEFLYGDNPEKADKVDLESGDVLIFGGKSRLIFHGVTSIRSDTASKALLAATHLRPGRLNLTFRES